ncbi:TPA: LOW QUALITY PROTEIN: hypothetical protein N0F65_005072, partial [Lagenidium giganteum]
TIIEFLLHHYEDTKVTPAAMCEAAKNGHFEALQYLHGNVDHSAADAVLFAAAAETGTKAAMDRAPKFGHQALVHDHGIDACSKVAMNDAAPNGHLAVVEFLYEYWTDGCTSRAIDKEAVNGHVGVVEYLLEHRNDGFTASALNAPQIMAVSLRFNCCTSIENKHFLPMKPPMRQTDTFDLDLSEQPAMVIWASCQPTGSAAERRQMYYKDTAIAGAAARGHLEVIQFLHERQPSNWSTEVMDATNGHLAIVQYLHTNRKEGFTMNAIIGAAANGHLRVVEFLGVYKKEGCWGKKRAQLIGAACDDTGTLNQQSRRSSGIDSSSKREASGAMEAMSARSPSSNVIMQVLNDHGFEAVLCAFLSDRQHNIATWAVTSKTTRGAAALRLAIDSARLDVVQALYDAEVVSFKDAFIDAARAGALAVLQWLVAIDSIGDKNEAMKLAAQHGHLAVICYLRECFSADEYDDPEALVMDGILECAAEFGHLHVVEYLGHQHIFDGSTRAMHMAAARGHFDIVQYLQEHCTVGYVDDAVTEAARIGRLDIIEFLLHRYEDTKVTPAAMCEAAKNGHFEVLQYLHGKVDHSAADAVLFAAAAETGRLDIVQFLEERRPPSSTEAAIAAKFGHLALVRYLHDHGIGGCTKMAMDAAATNGHLEVVSFLHHNRQEGCTTVAIDEAAIRGHATVVKFLLEHRDEGCTNSALERTAKNGHLGALQLLYKYLTKKSASDGTVNDTNRCMRDAFVAAACNGHVNVVMWLLEEVPTMIDDVSTSTLAAWSPLCKIVTANQLPVLQLLQQRQQMHYKDIAIAEAAARGHLDVIRFLHEHQSGEWSTDVMDAAATNGHLDVVWFLHTHRNEGCTTMAMDGAARKGHVRVLEFLRDNRTEGCSKDAWNEAIANGHLRVVRFLMAFRPSLCPKDAVNVASCNEDHRLVQLLLSYGLTETTVRL